MIYEGASFVACYLRINIEFVSFWRDYQGIGASSYCKTDTFAQFSKSLLCEFVVRLDGSQVLSFQVLALRVPFWYLVKIWFTYFMVEVIIGLALSHISQLSIRACLWSLYHWYIRCFGYVALVLLWVRCSVNILYMGFLVWRNIILCEEDSILLIFLRNFISGMPIFVYMSLYML